MKIVHNKVMPNLVHSSCSNFKFNQIKLKCDGIIPISNILVNLSQIHDLALSPIVLYIFCPEDIV